MQEVLSIRTEAREGLYDITREVENVIHRSGTASGIASVYVRGATAGIMIQENWDDSVQRDVVDLLAKVIPRGVWAHDR